MQLPAPPRISLLRFCLVCRTRSRIKHRPVAQDRPPARASRARPPAHPPPSELVLASFHPLHTPTFLLLLHLSSTSASSSSKPSRCTCSNNSKQSGSSGHMAQSGNSSPDDTSPTGAGFEYRSGDDAWYNVHLYLLGEKLKIKYSMLSGSPEEELHDARNFKSLGDVLRFRNRFRPPSLQLQDSECRKVVPGVTVCASYPSQEDDLRYFDAVVELVDHKSHSSKRGEEQCLCTFILFWQHGPGVGDLTSATVEEICLLNDGEIDQSLAEFIEMAKMMVDHEIPVADESGNEKDVTCQQGQISSDKEKDSYDRRYQDTDIGGVDKKLKFMTGRYTYAVVIDNLEKDLAPLTMMKFILNVININSQVHIFPSLLTDLYTRGVIEVNSREEFIELNGFLESTHQIIVSSHNRPWVTTERLLWKGDAQTIIPTSGMHSSRSHSDLKVVRSGTPEYNMAKELRENFTEFYNHGKRIVERLVFEEQKIMSRWTIN